MTPTREAWLQLAADKLRAEVMPPGLSHPAVLISVGLPKGGARKRGQCWYPEASADGTTSHVFISPVVTDPQTVLAILLHELVHVSTPGEKHRGRFIKVAKACGLLAPWTSSIPSEGLSELLSGIATSLGPYPHVGLTLPVREKQSTRMHLWECAEGKKIRRAGDLNAQCLDCGTRFERKGQ